MAEQFEDKKYLQKWFEKTRFVNVANLLLHFHALYFFVLIAQHIDTEYTACPLGSMTTQANTIRFQ